MGRHNHSKKIVDASASQGSHANKYAGHVGKKERDKKSGAWFGEHHNSSVGKLRLEQTAADAAEAERAEASQPATLPNADYFGFAVYPDGSFKVSSRNNESDIAWVRGNFDDYILGNRGAQVKFRFGGSSYDSLPDAVRVAQVNGWGRARDELRTIETLLDRKKEDFMRRHQATRPAPSQSDGYQVATRHTDQITLENPNAGIFRIIYGSDGTTTIFQKGMSGPRHFESFADAMENYLIFPDKQNEFSQMQQVIERETPWKIGPASGSRNQQYRFPMGEIIAESSSFEAKGSGTSPTGIHVSSLRLNSDIVHAAYIPTSSTPQIHILSGSLHMNFDSFQDAETAYAGRDNALRELDAIKLLMRDRGAKI